MKILITRAKRVAIDRLVRRAIEIGRADAESGSWDAEAIDNWPAEYRRHVRDVKRKLYAIAGRKGSI